MSPRSQVAGGCASSGHRTAGPHQDSGQEWVRLTGAFLSWWNSKTKAFNLVKSRETHWCCRPQIQTKVFFFFLVYINCHVCVLVTTAPNSDFFKTITHFQLRPISQAFATLFLHAMEWIITNFILNCENYYFRDSWTPTELKTNPLSIGVLCISEVLKCHFSSLFGHTTLHCWTLASSSYADI